MALKVDVTVQGGILVADAYVRIADITSYKNYDNGKYYMTIGLAVFKNAPEAAKINPRGQTIPCPEFDHEKCEFDLASTDNALVQAYTYLKTLDKFSAAEDV